MPHLLRITFHAMLAALALPCGGMGSASAQGSDAYPSRAITVIIPFPAGGPIDIESRRYTQKMSVLLGQPFVLDFKPGGGTAIGTEYVAKSRPDGYTLLAVTAALTVFPAFAKDSSLDIIRDLAPISLMSQRTIMLQSHPAFAPKTFAEYLAYAKANPGKINYGTTGQGESSHLAGAWLHLLTNTRATFIPYKGGGPLFIDLLAGRLDVAAGALLSAVSNVKAGKTRALAVMGTQRSRQFPDVPAIAEHPGLSDFSYSQWLGFVAPGPTPPAIVNRLSQQFAAVVKTPDMVAALDTEGSVAVGSTPAQFRQLIANETASWQKVVRDTGIKLGE